MSSAESENEGDHYSALLQNIISETELQMSHFPRPSGASGKAVLCNPTDRHYPGYPAIHKRKCKNCSRVYTVNNEGQNLINELCRFHKAGKPRGLAVHPCCGREKRFPCCMKPYHLHGDVDARNLTGFLSTRDGIADKSVYAIDCEMVHTTVGLEAAAVAVIDLDCQIVCAGFIKPKGQILDYNTEHSGILEKDLRNENYTLHDLHRELLMFIGPDTILVGHSLHHDLLRLKIIHDKILDTTRLYPHPHGLPFRKKLDDLRKEYLGGQTDLVSSSYDLKCANDASDTMKLAMLFVRRDL